MFSDNFVIVAELLIISPALRRCCPRNQEVWEHFVFPIKVFHFLGLFLWWTCAESHCFTDWNLPHHPRGLNHDSFQLSQNISAVCDKHKQLCTLLLPKTPFQVTQDACGSPVSNTQQISRYLEAILHPLPHVIFICNYCDGLRNIFYVTLDITII